PSAPPSPPAPPAPPAVPQTLAEPAGLRVEPAPTTTDPRAPVPLHKRPAPEPAPFGRPRRPQVVPGAPPPPVPQAPAPAAPSAAPPPPPPPPPPAAARPPGP